MNGVGCKNTDKELWREKDSYYSDSIHVTEGNGIGINCGGHVIVAPVRRWHTVGKLIFSPDPKKWQYKLAMWLLKSVQPKIQKQ
jgi:hypothetical protein